MKNNFANEYNQEVEIRNIYDEAKKNNSEDGKEVARKLIRELGESIEAKGAAYTRCYEYYKEMKDRGNDYIAIDECIFEDKAEGLINMFRECGITEFVYNSTWSGSVEVAWLFTTFGCKINGMVEINARTKKIFSEEYEKAHGLLFKIN